ncbi:MAG TPA: hypothetical protein VGC54_13860 [Planctomycetota bacterium]
MNMAFLFCVGCGKQLPIDAELPGLAPRCDSCGKGKASIRRSHPDRSHRGASGVRPDSGKPVRGLLGAAVGALAGAVLWATVAYTDAYELSHVGWAIGAMVGFTASRAGARGTVVAALCSCLALGGIATGKLLAFRMHQEREFRAVHAATFTPTNHAALQVEARRAKELLARLGAEAERQWREYAAEADDGALPPAGLARNLRSASDEARGILAAAGDFEAWRNAVESTMREAMDEQFEPRSILLDDVQAVDLVFALLGACTAFGMVRGRRRARS